MKTKRLYLAIYGIAAMATSSYAADFLPAVVYQGEKHDQAFNEQVFMMADQFKKEHGIAYLEARSANDAQPLQALRAVARRGANFIVAVAYTYAPTIAQAAKEFPQAKFVLVDAAANGSAPNLKSIMFREQEVAFLAGMAAALKSKTNTIGYIGGTAVPPIMAFGCGYAQGARHINSKIKIIQNMVANTSAGFLDPARGAEITRTQFDRGADVVFGAAHLTTLGILRQAKDSKKLAIGVDSNMNGLFPGTVLTSAMKMAGNIVYSEWTAALRGAPWHAGITTVGLEENVLGLAIDKHNRAVFDPALERRINQARTDIISGKIKVVDYRENNRCPVKY